MQKKKQKKKRKQKKKIKKKKSKKRKRKKKTTKKKATKRGNRWKRRNRRKRKNRWKRRKRQKRYKRRNQRKQSSFYLWNICVFWANIFSQFFFSPEILLLNSKDVWIFQIQVEYLGSILKRVSFSTDLSLQRGLRWRRHWCSTSPVPGWNTCDIWHVTYVTHVTCVTRVTYV